MGLLAAVGAQGVFKPTQTPPPAANPAPPAATSAPAATATPNTATSPDTFDPCVAPQDPAATPAAQAPATPAEAQARVEAAQAQLEEAGEAAGKKEEELQTMMAQVGAGLTPEQIQDLQTSFRAENEQIYAEEEAAAAELAAALEDPALDQQTRIEGYQQLAKSPSHAEAALEFAKGIAESDPALGASEEIQELAATALETALPSILANSPDAESAFAELEAYLEPLVSAAPAAGGVKEAYAALQDIRTGNYDALGGLADAWDNSLSRSIGIAAVAMGAVSAVGALQEQDYLKAIEDLGSSGSKGLELLVGFAQSANRASTGATSAAGVLGSAATRFASGLAAVGAAAGFAQDLKAFLDGKGEGYAVAALGDLIALAGSVSVATGVGAPIGALLIAVGTVISTIGRLFGAESEREQIQEALRDQLEKAGVPADLAELYSENFEEVGALGQAGWTPEEIQSLVRSDDFDKYKDNVDQLVMLAESGMSQAQIETFVNENSESFKDKHNVEAFLGFAEAAGLEPDEYVGFAEQLRQGADGEHWGHSLATIYGQISGKDVVGGSAPGTATQGAQLRNYLKNVFPDAHAFATSHAVEVYGEAGQREEEAGLEVDELAKYGNDIGWAQFIDEHADDPAYLDEVVQYVKEEYGQDQLEMVRNSVELYEGDSLAAFDEAVERAP